MSRKPDSRVRIKMERTHYGMKFFLPETLSEYDLLKLLGRIPATAYKLPDGQSIALDFANRKCSRSLILHMINSIVWEKDIKVSAWLSNNEESLKFFSAAGLSLKEPEEFNKEKNVPEVKIKKSEEKIPASIVPIEEHKEHISALKVVYNSMRSGQRIESEGDVIVWGHLNPGAEVVAGGSIIVAGRLLGVIHAGGYGREDVFVWAGCFETPQVRIANKLCYADSKTTACWRKSVLITLEDGTPMIRENKFQLGLKNQIKGGNFE